MEQTILYLTTKSNEWALDAFHALEQSMGKDADVYYVYHQQGDMLPVSLQNIEKLHVFSSGILSELGYIPIEKGKLVPGSNHFPFLKFFKENADYGYYWMVEDDVRFSGDWKTFFDSFVDNDSDFLSSFVETKSENPDWFWWSYLKTADGNVAEDRLLKSFNPICRLSHRALACIDEHLRNGWMGHHEVLIPTLLYNAGFTIEDIGGKGAFVKTGNERKFYDKASMDNKPLLPDGRKDYLFHPVKEEKVRKAGPYKRNAVFVAAGKDSLHRQLLRGDADFDLHLLIYDGSYNKYCDDSDFICCQSGYKMDMAYHYIHRHPEFLEKYEYFFLMDDDIEMSTEEVNKLFRMMREYGLKIAQPSLVMSYYTYEHTLHHPLCILRYTNFVEMMVPCFSREALMRVIPTFERKVRGSGIEFHWSKLIHDNHRKMAVIDAVRAKHMRILQSWSEEDEKNTSQYLAENKLSREAKEYAPVLCDVKELQEAGFLITDKLKYDKFRILLEENVDKLVLSLDKKVKRTEILPLSLLCHILGKVTQKKRYQDFSMLLLQNVVADVQKLDVTVELYEHLLGACGLESGRAFVLCGVYECLNQIRDYFSGKLCPIDKIIEKLTKHLKE